MIVFILFLSVIIGALIGYFLKQKIEFAKFLLSFSGAFLLGITVLHLLPESYIAGGESIGIWVLVGVIVQIVLEYLSKGAEHGHIHIHKKEQFPIQIFIGLFLHALLEGMPLATDKDSSLYLGIVIHKIPVAALVYISISDFFKDKLKQIVFVFLFAIASPLGVMLSEFTTIHQYSSELYGLISGIFLHISTTIIFESSKNHSFNIKKLSLLILGFLLAFFVAC